MTTLRVPGPRARSPHWWSEVGEYCRHQRRGLRGETLPLPAYFGALPPSWVQSTRPPERLVENRSGCYCQLQRPRDTFSWLLSFLKSRLSQNAGKRLRMHVIGGRSCDRYFSWLRRVLVLAMASTLRRLRPTVFLDLSDEVAYLQDLSRLNSLLSLHPLLPCPVSPPLPPHAPSASPRTSPAWYSEPASLRCRIPPPQRQSRSTSPAGSRAP